MGYVESAWWSRPATGRAAAVVLAGALLGGLGGCGTAAVPIVSETPPAASAGTGEPGLYATAAGPDPSGDHDFADGANDSDAAERPGSTGPDRSAQVERAASAFVAASLTRGFPDTDDTTYLRRTRRLMTAKGFGGYERLDARRGGPRAAGNLSTQHLRTRAEVRSVSPDLRAKDRARVEVEFRLVTERDEDGSWETLTIGPPQEQVLDLVDRPGSGWLVDATR